MSQTLAPYLYYDEEKGVSGFIPQLLDKVFTPLGCNVIYIDLPWGRALDLLEQGDIDLMANLSKTPERSRFINFVGPQNMERMVLVADTKKLLPVHSLTGVSQQKQMLGVLAKGYYGEEYEKLRQHNPEFNKHLILTRNSHTLMRMLRSERPAAVIDEEQVVKSWFSRDQMDHERFKIQFEIYTSPVYLGLSKASVGQDLLNRIETQFTRLRDTGLLKELANQHDVLLTDGN